MLSLCATSVSSNFYEQQNQRHQSRGFQKREESTLVLDSVASVIRSFWIQNICIKSAWRSGEKGTLAGSWRRERMPQTSTTGTGERQPAHSHTYSSHLDANKLKNTRLAVVCESTASRTLSTEENIVLATEQLEQPRKFNLLFLGLTLFWYLANGPLASSQVYPCHAFAASFMWRLSGRYISIIWRKSCLPFYFLCCQLSLRFCSCSVSVAWTSMLLRKRCSQTVFLELVKCWSGWVIRLTLLVKVYWGNRH